MKYLVVGFGLDDLVKEMDVAKVDKFVLFTLGGLFRNFQASNDEIATAAHRFPQRIIPFGTVNPWYGEDALKEMDRCVKVLKLKGFKLHPWMTSFPVNSELMYPIVEKLSELNVPVIIHSGTPPWSEPLQIGQLAKRFPEVKFIFAHMGITDLWKEALDIAKENSNVLLETSGAPTLAIKLAAQDIAPERIVFGSDTPFGGKGNLLFQMNKIKLLNLGSKTEELIFGGNLQRILKINGSSPKIKLL